MMSCDQLDNLRTAGGNSSAWPAEAQQHLQSCERCLELQLILEGRSEEEVPAALLRNIEAAILPSLSPVSPLPAVERATGLLLLSALSVVVVINWRLGITGWYARTMLQVAADLALLGICLTLLAHTLAVRMMPGSRHTLPILLYVGAALTALVSVVAALFGSVADPRFLTLSLACWAAGLACAAAAAPLFWMVLRKGYWRDQAAQGAAVGFLAGLVGAAVLELHCPYLDRLHIITSHLGAAFTAGCLGGALGFLARR